MHRTQAVMADGRELIYFDAAPGRQPRPDERDLAPATSVGELRFDPLTGEWVAIAGHRQQRIFQPSADASSCPLCPSTPANRTEVPDGAYEVAVFQNRFPSLAAPPDGWTMPEPAVGAATASAGRCEVVCFTDDHDGNVAELADERARLVVDAWADRTAALSALDHVALVFPFENSGVEIGVTIAHPHGQVYAYPTLPPAAEATLRAAREHRARTGRDLFDDVLAFELADGRRIVERTEHWVAFVPFAARWPYQVQLHPRRVVRDLAALTDAERDDLAALYVRTLRRLDGVLGVRMPRIAAWHQAPTRAGREDVRLYLDLFSSRRAPDKLKYLAGSEAAMGAFVNDISPEDAADRLRQAPCERTTPR